MLTVFFVAVIFTPFSLWLFMPDRERSTFEKRTLRQSPEWEWTWHDLVTFPQKLERYYEDQFGLRDHLITWHNLVHVRLFNKSPNKAVTLGHDNWLFYNAEHCLTDFLGLWRVDRVQLEAWRRVIRDRQTWLADQGVQYIVAIVPTKMMVYPQFLPYRIRAREGETLLAEFLRYVQSRDGGHGLLDLKEALSELEPHPSFFRTDTHWNGAGAFRAYKEILASIQERYPEIVSLDEKRKSVRHITFSGDLSIMLNLSSRLVEQTVDVQVSEPCSREIDNREEEDLLRTESLCVDHSHALWMIHDSYGVYIRPFFDETFREVVYTRSPLPELKELLSREKPAVIVDQRAARYFSRALGEDSEITHYVMRKHWGQSTDLRLHIGRHGGERFILNRHDLKIDRGDTGMILHATGPDPFVELSFAHTPVPDSFLVELELTSPVATSVQFFYTTAEHPFYAPERIVSREVQKGRNTVLFRLPHPDTQGRLRFDPGLVPGTYILHSLKIKGERFEL